MGEPVIDGHRCKTALVCALLVCGGPAIWVESTHAQTSPAAPSSANRSLQTDGPERVGRTLQRFDVSASLGWLNADKSEVAAYNEWYNRSLFTGVSFGWFWTDHLKTELEIGRTGEAEVAAYELVAVPGAVPAFGPAERRVDHYFSNVKISAAQIYQFRRNEWFHPFAGGGLDVDVERHYTETPDWRIGIRNPDGTFRTVDLSSEETPPRREIKPKIFGVVGFKAYLGRRTFFRSDLKIGGGDRLEQALWRIGFGHDF